MPFRSSNKKLNYKSGLSFSSLETTEQVKKNYLLEEDKSHKKSFTDLFIGELVQNPNQINNELRKFKLLNTIKNVSYELYILSSNTLDVETSLWLDASDLSTLSIDSNNKVLQWDDKSGNSRNAVPSSGEEPELKEDYVYFDGTDDSFNVDLDFLAGQDHVTFILSREISDLFNNQYGYYGAANGNSGSNSLHVGFKEGKYMFSVWGDDYRPNIGNEYNSQAYNILEFYGGSSLSREIIVNETSTGTGNTVNIGTMSGGGKIVDVTDSAYYHIECEIKQFIILLNDQITTENITKVREFLNARL